MRPLGFCARADLGAREFNCVLMALRFRWNDDISPHTGANWACLCPLLSLQLLAFASSSFAFLCAALMASPPESPLSPASPAGLPAAPLPPQSPPPVLPPAVDYSGGMHLAPGYKEFLRRLIVNGGGLLVVHQAAWRRAFPDEPIPPTVPFRHDGDPGVEVGDAAVSSEAEELSGGEPLSEGSSSASEGNEAPSTSEPRSSSGW